MYFVVFETLMKHTSAFGLSDYMFIYCFPSVSRFVQGRALHGPGDEARQHRSPLQVGWADPR